MAEPPMHTVSDPLPLSTVGSEDSIDEWFKANFDALFTLPPPADVAEPDLSTQWEVELFNDYILPSTAQETLIPPIDDNRVSSSTDLTAFDDLLQSLESDGLAVPPEIMYWPTMAAVPGPVSQGLPLLLDYSQSIDWTALSDSFGPTNDPLLPLSCDNSALPEIDLPILQLPQVWTTVVS